MTEETVYAANREMGEAGGSVTVRDGLQENILLLHALSEQLDNYFAMQTLGEFPAEG